jgi:arylsulfatase A-like enzyme
MRTPVTAAILLAGLLLAACRPAADRPNVLWITCEDIGPHLGAYGDSYADTPNLDRLASQGMTYAHAWSNAPVCAPARTAIIAGMYPTSTGSEHMRSMTRLPAGMKMYPQYLREAGYYCTNNAKEDYNLEKPGEVWDESSNTAHWRNRKPGQPFFAIFNLGMTHESGIRRRPHTPVHDPAKVRLPAYHPDTPEVRLDWAQYHDKITEMDQRAGEILAQLHEDGLAEDTVVFFYGDHGPGMPRSKRWPYNSGLHVPLIVHVPEKFRHLAPKDWEPGGTTGRLAAFVDLAPTLLSLAGIQPPSHPQGHALLGRHTAPEQTNLFGFRGRMDERYDLVRSVRDQRYVYIRNYMPHKIYGQYLAYMFQTPTTQVWKRLYDEGKLNPAQRRFWETKPPEELYDLETDPDEIQNLAGLPEHRETLERLRQVLRKWILDVRDVGFLPEGEIHSRSESSTPYDMGHDPRRYPLERILDTADLASSLKPDAAAPLLERFNDGDSAVRYWAAMGILMRGAGAVRESRAALHRALGDSSPCVRIVAAEALGRYGEANDLDKSLAVLLELAPGDRNGIYVAMMALNAIDALGEKAGRVRTGVAKLPREDPAADPRMRAYIGSLIDRITAR